MHEASIAQSILDIAGRHCRSAGYGGIQSVRVKIGKASGVLSDALCFAFDALKTGTLAEGAALFIDEVPLGGACRVCKADFTTDEPYIFSCPNCGSPDFKITSGRELDVIEIETT